MHPAGFLPAPYTTHVSLRTLGQICWIHHLRVSSGHTGPSRLQRILYSLCPLHPNPLLFPCFLDWPLDGLSAPSAVFFPGTEGMESSSSQRGKGPATSVHRLCAPPLYCCQVHLLYLGGWTLSLSSSTYILGI